jgi:hypothetical protein
MHPTALQPKYLNQDDFSLWEKKQSSYILACRISL